MTIIVLLILAGVTISTLFSDNGIIKKAQEAANKTQEAVNREQSKLNQLYNELLNEIVENPKIVVTHINEDSISVKVDTSGEKLSDFQFSLDNQNWSEEQQLNEYTFTNLEKVIVDETNYKSKRGNEYTIYAKAKNDKNNEVLFDSIKARTTVEVQADISKFLYEETDDGIRITGINPNNIEFTASNIKEFDEKIKKATLIPSYVEDKPVTEIDINLILENINKIAIGQKGLIWGEAQENETIFNQESVNFNFGTSEIAYVSDVPIVYFDKTENKKISFRFLAGNTYAYKETNSNEIKDNVKLDLKIINTELVIPPTVNTINNEEEKNNISSLRSKGLDSPNPYLDIDEPDMKQFEFALSKENVGVNASPHITFLGRENTENINNSNIFWEVLKNIENYNVEYLY